MLGRKKDVKQVVIMSDKSFERKCNKRTIG